MTPLSPITITYCHCLHFFPRLPLVTCFPTLFSRAFSDWFHFLCVFHQDNVFPQFHSLVTCFFVPISGYIFLELVIIIVSQLKHTLTTYLRRFVGSYESQGSYRTFHSIWTDLTTAKRTSELWMPQRAALATRTSSFSCFKQKSETETVWITFWQWPHVSHSKILIFTPFLPKYDSNPNVKCKNLSYD